MEGNRAARRASGWRSKGRSKGYAGNIYGSTVKAQPVEKQKIITEYTPREVYRIEHPESGQGPFTHQSGRGLFASDAMVYMKEPQEMCEGLRCGSSHHYAFVSMDILMRNVQRFVLLREYGFHFSVYESNEYLILPDGQVAFIMEKSKRLLTTPVHEFPFENYF